ncbi:transposase, partial [Streptomyces sp. SID161]|uniref:transposase n=1 Tax=Streptomyces sp. SID161 TaxID=2690251 RepID=UPI001367FD25|nr:transposase [Streptomyces sp. SID161]
TANRLRLGSRCGRPPAFDRGTYKQRNTVERCINKLKQWRGLATRYDKTATTYLAGLHLAAIFIWSASGSEGKGLRRAPRGPVAAELPTRGPGKTG